MREQCYNNYGKGAYDFDDLEEASHQLTLDDFAPNFLSKPPGVYIHSDRSKEKSETPGSGINDSASENNRLSELVRLVDKRKKMMQERERNMLRTDGNQFENQNPKSHKVGNRIIKQKPEERQKTVGQKGRKDSLFDESR